MPASPTNLEALWAFLVALVLALVVVPMTRWLAVRVGAIDYPNERSLHTVPTPKLGGLGILVAAVVAGLLWLPDDTESHAIIYGAIAIAYVGFLDDVFDLPAAAKLLGQVVAVVIPVSAGVTVENFTIPFFGRLFRHTTEQNAQTDLVIMITPRIVR